MNMDYEYLYVDKNVFIIKIINPRGPKWTHLRVTTLE